MKTILSVSAVALALSTGASFAQQPSDAAPPPPGNTTAVPESNPPAAQASPSDEGRPRADWRRGRGDRRLPPPSKAAHFYIQDGDVKIDIKCADDEPTKVCADLLLQMLDRLEGSSLSRDDRDRDRDRGRDGDGYR
ncbi:hypothetical protein [Rhizobium sp. P32RR-XVIII]|uniref:hypothetical protein n=1 Tax=Rhizobium sp. P32RR-XVIII TaxID=2726738 RepID=UPI0028A9F0A6|nr:hypothetical protein [Rhizobium sp. P32RR-XVIII]